VTGTSPTTTCVHSPPWTRIRVGFDGEPLLELDDATFPEGGRIGLWTKADATTWFDDLRVATPSAR
jgi:hypothetical protein